MASYYQPSGSGRRGGHVSGYKRRGGGGGRGYSQQRLFMPSMMDDPWIGLIGTNEKGQDVSSPPLELDIYGGHYRAQQSLSSIREAPSSSATVVEYAAIDIDSGEFETSEALEVFGLDHLKAELKRRGLKIGGTLQERAVRLFASRETTSQFSGDNSCSVKLNVETERIEKQKAAVLAKLDLHL